VPGSLESLAQDNSCKADTAGTPVDDAFSCAIGWKKMTASIHKSHQNESHCPPTIGINPTPAGDMRLVSVTGQADLIK
jgi:hypothetical protein